MVDDPNRFGLELADATIARMEAEALSGHGGAIFAAQEIVQRADEMVASGATGEAAARWAEAVTTAYGARLEERIKATEQMVDLRPENPQ
jgi:uncharacterized protein (DUF697 family)